MPPSLDHLTPATREKWTDAIGRSVMARELILDSKPGILDMMTKMTYPDQKGRHPAFGEGVLEAARAL